MKKRELELDLLRILAMMTVILVHCQRIIDRVDDPGVHTFYSVLSTLYSWEIPVFVMISGRFFLDPSREMPFRKILQAVKRIVAAFLFWNIIYQVFYILSGAYSGLNWKGIVAQAFEGPYHFWFLFMIAGLYLITPFLRLIAERKRLTEYFLLLFFCVELCTGYLTDLPFIGRLFSVLSQKGALHFVTGFSGCYLLGYYLHEYTPSKRTELILYGTAVLLAFAASFATLKQFYPAGASSEYFYQYLKPNIIVVASAIYVFFTKRVSRHPFSRAGATIISFLSEHSFGIYLVHALYADLLLNTGMLSLNVFPLAILPEHALRVLLVSLLTVFLLRKIPKLGKMIT